MTRKNALVEKAIEVLGLDMSDAKVRGDLEMIVSLVGPQAVQKRIEDVEASQTQRSGAGF